MLSLGLPFPSGGLTLQDPTAPTSCLPFGKTMQVDAHSSLVVSLGFFPLFLLCSSSSDFFSCC